MSDVKLSVVIITKNEENKIAKCLESIKWVDEIVVVDDLSQDRTVEISREYGAKVVSHKSDGNFDRQRNIGIDNATSSWILQMDADEIVTPELKVAIQKAIDIDSEFSAFQFKRKNFFLNHFMKYGGFYGAYSIKLFKKAKARYIGHSVHETLKVDGKVGTIKEDINHYAFQSIAQNIDRNNMYSTVRAKIMKEDQGKLDEKTIKYNLTIRPVKTFWKMYVKKKGYKDGMHGLVFAILFTFGPMLRWIKYWELLRGDNEDNFFR